MFANRIKKYGGTGGSGPGGVPMDIELNGVDQYLHTVNPVGDSDATAWAVSVWMLYFADQAPAVSVYKYIWQNRLDIGSGFEQSGLAVNVDTQSLYIRRNGGWSQFTLTGFEIEADAWHHLVLIGTPTQVQMYVDAVFRGPITDSTLSFSGYSCFGGSPFPSATRGDNLGGLLDDIRLFDRQLVQADVTELYENRNLPIATPPEYLQAFLDEGPADSPAVGAGSIIDTSAASNNLTPVNSPIYRLTA